MPPKKKGEKKEEEKPYLGRPGNNVGCGVVGLPSVGKSLLFNVLSGLQVPSEAYAFTTIDPNVAKVKVPDERFTHLCEAFKPKSEVPASLGITDIAGLVKGASTGAGLGNAFLSHIFAVDAIYHVCRAFADKTVEHVDGDVDPVRDLQTIHDELRLKDIARVKALLQPLKKGAGAKMDKAKAAAHAHLTKIEAHLEGGNWVTTGDWDPHEVEFLNTLHLLSAKPEVILVNLSMKGFRSKKCKWFAPIKQWVDANAPGSPIIPFSAKWEAAYREMSPEEQKAECEEHGVISMMPRVIHSGYKALKLQTFFTAGADEVRAWVVREGWKAPQAAGVIHTDFEKGFICADTYNYADWKELGSEAEVKKNGKLRMEGKQYVVKDGDVFHFKFNN